MIPWLEISANLVNAASIALAARNSAHTWPLGIVGCALFCALFYRSQLYADALLQIFFIATSAWGWVLWAGRREHAPLPVTRITRAQLVLAIGLAGAASLTYGYALHRLTDAYAPFVDSLVLGFSVSAQLLLMRRRYEAWWLWLFVNTLAVALFATRGLWITAVLYTAFWVNAAVASVQWRRLIAQP